MKKNRIIFLILLILLISSVAMAESTIIIRIDSEAVEFNKDIGMPFIDENSRTQVPFRATLEKFGATVDWDEVNRVAIAEKDNIVVKVPIGENFIFKNDVEIATDTKALVKDKRTYLPIRPVIEAFGSTVEWDNELRTVVITTEDIDIEGILKEAYNKSNQWKSFESNNSMDVKLTLSDKSNIVENMPLNMNMKMSMTNFIEPLKGKVSMEAIMDLGSIVPITEKSEMYYQGEGDKLVNYISKEVEGKTIWYKEITENQLLEKGKDSQEEKSKLIEESVRNIKFYGKYQDNKGRSFLRIENTNRFSLYEDYSAKFLDAILPLSNESIDISDIFSNLDNIKYIVYIDEYTGEIIKYNIDLSSVMKPIFQQLLEAFGDELVTISHTNVNLEVEIFNINKAKDFDMPIEILNALELQTY